MASDGTPLEAIETGEISNTADSGRMQAILRDMNAPGVDAAPRPQSPQMPPMHEMAPMATRQMPPTLNISQHQQPFQHQQMHQPPSHYEGNPTQYYQEPEQNELVNPKKNVWSTILDYIIDPIFVMVIFFVLSLPVFHAFLGKYATWAFAVGGQLSWLGLSALAVFAGILFAFVRLGRTFAGF